MYVGKSIKEYLKETGITQTFVAKKAGIPINTFNAMCNGKQQITAEQYFQICTALGQPVNRFVREDTNASA